MGKRQVATAAVGAFALVFASLTAALGQTGPKPATMVVPGGGAITPLGIYAGAGVVCAAVSPMVGTILLGREMTAVEVSRSTLNCFLGPLGWLLGPVLFPTETAAGSTPPRAKPPRRSAQQGRGRNFRIPPPGETRFVRDEVLLEIAADVSPRTLDAIARQLQLTRLETQRFSLISRTLQRWRIDGNRSVAATLRALARYRFILQGQANHLYILPQSAEPAQAKAGTSQYVVSKLNLLEAHRVSTGDAVTVAIIDSMIDAGHPDLAGVIAGQYDARDTPGKPHAHGTAMAGAIAAHGKLLGVAPKVRLLAVRSFAGEGEHVEGTSFAILKGLDWSAAHGARIVNMSFAGPADGMLHEMLGKAHDRGIVLIAAVGNAGPRSPPLFPAADPAVIGVTATDADNKLLPLANRGPQVTVAAPGVNILAVAPDGDFALTSGTSVAAAHVSGVAALLLARKPALTPNALRQVLARTAQRIPGKPRDVGAGVVDALGAVESLKP